MQVVEQALRQVYIFLVEGFAVNNDGSKTYYKTFGKGEPLLIINGGPGMNSNGFEDMAKTLGENQQTIIYDQRGTGKSKLSKLDSKSISFLKKPQSLEV